ncbi:MAG: hypothetical protein NWR72_07555 [Bacteroidia bacterium]|nr:hypothetical protein [Bacteroidia bacterium]
MQKLILLSALLLLFACNEQAPSTSEEPQTAANPAADGFDLAGSDSAAIVIADEVMEAMGGRAAWDRTHYLNWTFLSGRKLLWDKYTNRVRIDFPSQNMTLVTDIETGQGKALVDGQEITEADSLASLMDMAKGTWINDSYWLVMPFKLKDSGVTLTYVGPDSTQTGAMADVLELRFEAVGVTPQNKYLIWVGQESHLMEQWAFFANASDAEPGFTTPWRDYQSYGDILLSGDRGVRLRDGQEFPLLLPDISVSDSVDEALFLGVN